MEHLCIDTLPHFFTGQPVVLEVELKRPCMQCKISAPVAVLPHVLI